MTQNKMTLEEFNFRSEGKGISIEGKEFLLKYRDELESSNEIIMSILSRIYNMLRASKIKKIIFGGDQHFVDNIYLDTNKVFLFIQEKWIGIYLIDEKTFVIQRHSFC